MTKPIICRFATSQETERLVADPAPGITAQPHEDNLRYFDVTIQGPDGSPFQSTSSGIHDQWLPTSYLDGVFRLELFLPEEYPMAPPKVRFLTKIYHPNIGIGVDIFSHVPRLTHDLADKLGRICLDILKGE